MVVFSFATCADNASLRLRIRKFGSAEHFQVRNFCVNDQASIARQFDDEVRFPVAGVLLFVKVAVCAEAGRFDDATKRLFAPSAARCGWN